MRGNTFSEQTYVIHCTDDDARFVVRAAAHGEDLLGRLEWPVGNVAVVDGGSDED